MASKILDGFPRQSSPDTRVLVSTTALTSPPLLPDDIHFRLDFLHAHRFAGLAAYMVKHQQPIGLRLFYQRLRQIQLNREANNTGKMTALCARCQIGMCRARPEGDPPPY